MNIIKVINHKTLLKAYLLLIVLLFGYAEITSDDIRGFVNYIDDIFWIMTLLGIFGYAFDKKIFAQKFWQFFLLFIIPWDLFFLAHEFDLVLKMDQPFKLSIFILIYLAILTPGYIALYLYGHSGTNSSIKKRTKISLIAIGILLITNAVTYKFAYHDGMMSYFLPQVRIEAMMLKQFDKNDTKFVEINLNATINSFLMEAGTTDDIEQYRVMCRQFDKELFRISDRYASELGEPLVDGDYGKRIRENLEKMEIGRLRMKELCDVNMSSDTK